jgi:hypothetical protein
MTTCSDAWSGLSPERRLNCLRLDGDELKVRLGGGVPVLEEHAQWPWKTKGMGAIKERRTTAMLEKSRRIKRGLETVLIIGALAMAFCLAAPRAARAQTANLQMLGVNPLDFKGAEVVATCTTLGTPGAVVKFYDNTVTGTSALDTMLVTLSATGDVEGNNRLQVQCKVDDTPCFAGSIGADGATGPGWVVLQQVDEDELDNNVNYTWCVPIKKTKKNAHEVVLNLQNLCNNSASGSHNVFLEQINVVVEAFHAGVSKLEANACTTAGTGSHGP